MISYLSQRWAWGCSCESGYGSGLTPAQLVQCIKLNNLQFSAEPVNRWTDAENAGKNHRFPIEMENLEWRSMGIISGVADSQLLGLLLKLAMGKCSSVDYQHQFTFLSLDEAFQKPSTAVAFQNDQGSFRMFSGLQATRLFLAGGDEAFMQFSATLSGDGRIQEIAGFSPPASREINDFRRTFASLYIGGEIVTAKVKTWSMEINTELLDFREFAQDQFALIDPANEAAGYYLLAHEWVDHSVKLEMEIILEDWQPWELMASCSPQSVDINNESTLLNSFSELDNFQISCSGVQFTVSQDRNRNHLVWKLSGQPLISDLSTDFVITLNNDIATY